MKRQFYIAVLTKKNKAMHTINEFKKEYRLTCTDTWGHAMDIWFDIASHLWQRKLPIPTQWQYRPGIDPVETDSYFYNDLSTMTDKLLIDCGNLMFRYCQFLRFKGIDY